MVKNILSVIITFSLLLGASLYESYAIRHDLINLQGQVQTLLNKTEDGSATIEDAKTLKMSWEKEKEFLHVWIPHNDLTSIDLHLNEAIGYLYCDENTHALAKLVVVLSQFEKLPDSYTLSLENIF